MDWLKKILPTAAAALGGPLAGIAVELIGPVLGLSAPTVDDVKKKLEEGNLTPEQITALRQIEADLKKHESEMNFKFADLEFQREKLAVENTTDARLRDRALIALGKHNWRADIMFLLAVAVICALVFLVWSDEMLNEYVKGIFTLVLGRFLGYLDNIYNFEFGSTRNNRTKDETIQQLSSK